MAILLCFHISLHPIQGYELPSYNIYLKETFLIQSFLFKTHFSKNQINYHSQIRLNLFVVAQNRQFQNKVNI